jgi:hypothetical protein
MGTHIDRLFMKTTIDIADDLIRRARQVQKREDITLRALVEEGLRYAIGRHTPAAKQYKFNLPVAGQPYEPGMAVVDVTAIIRDSYEQAENSMSIGRVAEPKKRYGARAKSTTRKTK